MLLTNYRFNFSLLSNGGTTLIKAFCFAKRVVANRLLAIVFCYLKMILNLLNYGKNYF